MSCGPAKAITEMADQLDALNEKIDATIMDIPGMGELAGLKDKVESQAQGLMDKLNEAMPSIKMPELPFDQLPLQDQFKQLAGLAALGYLRKDEFEDKLEKAKSAFEGLDFDVRNLDDLADQLRSGAMRIDDICKLVPNVQTQGVNLEVKGVPTSFPNVDPVAMIKGGELPKLPSIDGFTIEPEVISKAQADDFLQLELPTFDW